MVTATKEQPICPQCESKEVSYRIKLDNYICRRCGKKFDWKAKEKGEK